jgi:hypothetical protein
MSQLAIDGTGPFSDLTRLWAVALAPLVVRHPTGAVVRLTLLDGAEPTLRIELDSVRDNRDPGETLSPFVISCVRLTFFPGMTLARQWFAAGWAGLGAHESCELVTIGNLVDRPFDPHAEPYHCDRPLRIGLPPVLDRASMEQALTVVMSPEHARALMEAG